MKYLSLAEVQVIGLNKENNSKISIAGYLGCGELWLIIQQVKL
jgi:hypothetical protein